MPFQGDYDVHLAEGDCQAQKAVGSNPKMFKYLMRQADTGGIF